VTKVTFVTTAPEALIGEGRAGLTDPKRYAEPATRTGKRRSVATCRQQAEGSEEVAVAASGPPFTGC